MKTKLYTLIIICLTSVACDNTFTISHTEGTGVLKLDNNPLYQPKVETSYIMGNYGVYVDYMKNTDNLIGLSSSKPGPFNSHRIYGYAGPSDISDTKSISTPCFTVAINGNEFTENAVTKSSSLDLKNLYGSMAQFSIMQSDLTKSNDDATVVDMYIPEEIYITNPYVESGDNMLPLCYYDGFHLEWNKDTENPNGVIAIIEWVGELVVGNDVPDTYLRRFCILDDTGKAVLPNEFFEGIPDTAVCHMTLLRGNIETLSINDSSYKIQAESHEFMSFILIREIEYV